MKGFAAALGQGTGYQIRDYLLRVGSDNQMNIWRAIKLETEAQDNKAPSWSSFQNFFRLLKRANLVIEDTTGGRNSTATDTSSREVSTAFEKKYYKVNPANVSSTAWYNVYAFLGY
jgi:hypothetical protein